MGLRATSSVQTARAGRSSLGLRMQQATAVDQQENGVGQASMRKDAESLMQPCPVTKYNFLSLVLLSSLLALSPPPIFTVVDPCVPVLSFRAFWREPE